MALESTLIMSAGQWISGFHEHISQQWEYLAPQERVRWLQRCALTERYWIMLPQTSASLYTYCCSLGSVLEELVQQLLRSLSNVIEMNAYTAVKYVCVCVCTRMLQTSGCWADFDEIWYGRYAIGGYPKRVPFNFQNSAIPTWRTYELLGW
jgi:hypothetical protein